MNARPTIEPSGRALVTDPDFTLYVGDALDTLRTLDAGSVDCCVTSPPYWGLRDYGTGEWEGGDPECDHLVDRFASAVSDKQASNAASGSKLARETCPKCGARRVDRQLGLEATPDEYVASMVAVFREVRRVLADHGTCWVNLGDSYAAQGGPGQGRLNDGAAAGTTPAFRSARYERNHDSRTAPAGMKPKDLCGIPWRVAFALQADGWYLRSDIIWSKPNPMPESVTDRPTKAHEYVFLLSKSPRYFFDQEAVREPGSVNQPFGRLSRQKDVDGSGDGRGNRFDSYRNPEAGRNVRSVWEIATQPYAQAHFATFPEELPRRCILAGCPEGGTVLDPFLGSGTTALVARKHGRRCVGIELNPKYAALAAERCQQLSLLA